MRGYLTEGQESAWYELGVQGTGILIHVHRTAASLMLEEALTATAPEVVSLRKRLNLPEFIGPKEPRWGFGEVLRRRRIVKRNDWVSWTCPLPVVFSPQEADPYWGRAFAVSATLKVLFETLRFPDEEMNFRPPNVLISGLLQLLVIDAWASEPQLQGGSFSVSLSPTLCAWIARHPEGTIRREISAIMKRAYRRMFRRAGAVFTERNFRVWYRRPKWIHLECPGDACGLDPAYSADESPDRGYKLSSHNVDSPLQQLTLLAGIAAMHQLARREL